MSRPLLIQELEKALGFEFAEFQRLPGAAALNYRVVRASDGLVFVAKFSRPGRKMFDCLVEHLESLKGTKAVRRVFERECPTHLAGYNVICVSWCPGESLMPDRLTDGEFLRFLDDYLDFSRAMQRVRTLAPDRPPGKWLVEVTRRARGGLGGRVLACLLREIDPADMMHDPRQTCVIHGDFHHGNFHFANGRLSGVFDLEELHMGHPTVDIVRYFTCAIEHLNWYELCRERRMMHLFRLAVLHLPYSRHEWIAAINGRLLNKMWMKVHRQDRVGLVGAVNLTFRACLYRRLRAIVHSFFESEVRKDLAPGDVV